MRLLFMSQEFNPDPIPIRDSPPRNSPLPPQIRSLSPTESTKVQKLQQALMTLLEFTLNQGIPVPDFFLHLDLQHGCIPVTQISSLSRYFSSLPELRNLHDLLRFHSLSRDLKVPILIICNSKKQLYYKLLLLIQNSAQLTQLDHLRSTFHELQAYFTARRFLPGIQLTRELTTRLVDYTPRYVEREWRQVKRDYLLQVLNHLLQQNIPLPEIVYGLKAVLLQDRMSVKVEVHPHKKLIRELKNRGFFDKTLIYEVQHQEPHIIMKMLEISFRASESRFAYIQNLMQDQEFNDVLRDFETLRYTRNETVHALLKVIRRFQQYPRLSQRQVRKQILKSLTKIYLVAAIDRIIPNTDLLQYLDVKSKHGHQMVRIKNFFNLVDSYAVDIQFQDITDKFDVVSYLRWSLATIEQLQDYLSQVKSIQPARDLAGVLADMLHLIYDHRYRLKEEIKIVLARPSSVRLLQKVQQRLPRTNTTPAYIESAFNTLEGLATFVDHGKTVEEVAPVQPVVEGKPSSKLFTLKKGNRARATTNVRALLKLSVEQDIVLPEILLHVHLTPNNKGILQFKLIMKNQLFEYLENEPIIVDLLKRLVTSQMLVQETEDAEPQSLDTNKISLESFDGRRLPALNLTEHYSIINRIQAIHKHQYKFKPQLMKLCKEQHVQNTLVQLKTICDEENHPQLEDLMEAYKSLLGIWQFVSSTDDDEKLQAYMRKKVAISSTTGEEGQLEQFDQSDL